MARLFLSSVTLTLALTASAHLAPGTDAPLSMHMMEVNKEWQYNAVIAPQKDRMVRFESDMQRIAMHLELVQRALSASDPSTCTDAQNFLRSGSLQELRTYAQRGVFPRNQVLPYRNPVFIDPYGTACAVGQLMIASGSADLAQRIDREMETAYIRDMHRTDVLDWATEHGFTEEELAWIQPGYSSDVPWTAFPGAPSGEVNTVLVLDNGDIIVAGTFTSASGLPITNVARYDGIMFHAMGGGLQGAVNCGVIHEGAVILGGQFNGHDIATWSGADWTLSSTGGIATHVYALHVHEGELYAAATGSGISHVFFPVCRMNDGQWDAIGVFNRPVYALGSYTGELIAGGAFVESLPFVTGVPADHIARFDGEGWSQLGDGLDTTVYALRSVGGELYAGGLLYADGAPTFGLARFTNDAWTTVPGLHDQLTTWANGTTEIRALAEYDGELVFGGSFNVNSDLVVGRCIGRLGTNDEIEPLGFFNNTVRTFAVNGVNLLAGGDFSQVNFATARTVVTTDLTTVGIAEADRNVAHVWPDPATDNLSIDIPDGIRPVSVSVVDGQGRTMQQAAAFTGGRRLLDVSGLASGMYSVVLQATNGSRYNARFIKE